MRPMLAEINEAVVSYFGLERGEITSTSRVRGIARPRQIAMYLAREMTVRSYHEIANQLGGMDHTTIIHGVRNIAALIDLVPEVARDVVEVRGLVEAIVGQRLAHIREAA